MIQLSRMCVSAAFLLAAGLSSLAAGWTGGRGPGNRGAFPDVQLPKNPAVVWKAYLGPEYVNKPVSSTVVAGDTVIAAFGNLLVAAAIDTGQFRWQLALGEVPLSDLLYLDGQIVVSLPAGSVQGINPANGTVKWKIQLRGGLRNAPTYDEKLLYFATKNRTIEFVTRDSIAKGAGKLLGTIDAQDKIEAAPVLYGKGMVLSYTEGKVRKVDENGVSNWNYVIQNGAIGLTPVTDGKLVFVISTGLRLLALNPQDRSTPVKWTVNFNERVQDELALEGNKLYVVSRSGNRIFAIDTATGKQLWTVKTKGTDAAGKPVDKEALGLPLIAPPIGSPLVLANGLLLRQDTGLVALYDKTNGGLKWVYRMKPPTGLPVPKKIELGAPAIVGDDLFFAGTDAQFYHLNCTAPDVDPPTFDTVSPDKDNAVVAVGKLNYIGAVIQDEGSGMDLNSVKLSLDREDLTSSLRYDPGTGTFYFMLNPASPLKQGVHRLVINATDMRGNKGTLQRDFVLAAAETAERAMVEIKGEFLPKHLRVKPGTIITWVNNAGSPRTIVADDKEIKDEWHFNSDEFAPDGIIDGDRWVWIVPPDAEYGNMLYYHDRLNGKPGNGEDFGTGLVGLIEIGDPLPTTPLPGTEGYGPGFEPVPGEAPPPDGGPILDGAPMPRPAPPPPDV